MPWGVGSYYGKIFQGDPGFLRTVLRGEQRNPEILLENAVQDELNNLKKLQVAAARTMAYEKMLTSDAATKQKVVAAKESARPASSPPGDSGRRRSR